MLYTRENSVPELIFAEINQVPCGLTPAAVAAGM